MRETPINQEIKKRQESDNRSQTSHLLHFLKIMANSPKGSKILAAVAASLSVTSAVTELITIPAHATLADSEVQALNPRYQKYGTCPTDSPCYILETRIIRAKVADPSEVSGDENYILPIWAIVDGMGVNPHPHVLSTGSEDIFRINVSKRTIGGERGSNMGTMFWQRKTSSWVDLQNRDPNAYRLHLNKDFVIPISRERWSSEGLIFSTTMMEHDNSQGRDIDRAYLQMARKVQSGLLQGATQARARLNNPTYYGDAMKATEKFVKEAAPIAAKAYATYQTGGAAAAAGTTDLDTVTNLFKNLWQGLAKLDKDDVGQQVSVYIPFASLRPGVEKKQQVCGKTDPTAINTGRFCVEIGVKLTPYSAKRTPSAFDKARQAGDAGSSNQPAPGNNQPPAAGSTPGSNNQDTACANSSTYMGVWSFKDLATNKYARGGVTAEGRNDLVGALGTAVSNPNRAWESFRLYSIPGVAGGRRLQNTIDGRWLETVNNTGSLLLHGPVRTCRTSTKDMQWRVVPVAGQRGVYKLQNLRSNQFVRVTPGGLLKANASEAQATPFSWNKY